jgi:ATP-dependent RNA helicase RhlE
MTHAFSELNLADPLARAVAEMGYTAMTPIQAQAIPVVLQGRDVMGAAQTGTGKTAAFSLPLLQRLLRHANTSTSPARHPVRALVLLPTRELADQVAQQIKLYAKYTPLRCAVVFGGMDMKPQVEELRKGVEILVATPGRLLDHIEAKTAVLNQVEYVVLDEADRMLDIGFLPDLQRILSYLPKQRTTLLFSATFSPEIKRLAASYLQDPVVIEVARANTTASTVEQRFFRVEEEDKRQALKQLLREHQVTQAFVFVNSKLGCARLARALERATGCGWPHCTATRARTSASRRWTRSSRGRSICWCVPTSPRAGSTSRMCRRCSTSTSRSTRRTMSTVSAARVVPVPRG